MLCFSSKVQSIISCFSTNLEKPPTQKWDVHHPVALFSLACYWDCVTIYFSAHSNSWTQFSKAETHTQLIFSHLFLEWSENCLILLLFITELIYRVLSCICVLQCSTELTLEKHCVVFLLYLTYSVWFFFCFPSSSLFRCISSIWLASMACVILPCLGLMCSDSTSVDFYNFYVFALCSSA